MQVSQGCYKVWKSQEKLRKMTKVSKNQVKWDFLLKSGNLTNLKKTSDFISLNLPNSLYSKAFEW